MQKFTIFTIIFSFAVVLVMAELVINDYLETKNQVLESGKAQLIKDEEENSADSDKESEEVEKSREEEIINPESLVVSENLLKQAGFKDVLIKTVPFSGKLFALVELPGVDLDSVIKATVFQGEEYSVTLYEMHFDDMRVLEELYQFIIDDARKKPNIAVNETNSFGDKSFYVNNAKKTKVAFLVVQKGQSLYAFEYAHGYHPLVKKLLSLL